THRSRAIASASCGASGRTREGCGTVAWRSEIVPSRTGSWSDAAITAASDSSSTLVMFPAADRRFTQALRNARGSPHEQRHSPPAPEAVDVRQSGVAHPDQLRLDVDEPVLRIIGGPPDGSQELRVQHRCGRRDDLQVGEDAARAELTSDVADEAPLASG